METGSDLDSRDANASETKSGRWPVTVPNLRKGGERERSSSRGVRSFSRIAATSGRLEQQRVPFQTFPNRLGSVKGPLSWKLLLPNLVVWGCPELRRELWCETGLRPEV